VNGQELSVSTGLSRHEVDFIWEEQVNKPVPVEVKTLHRSGKPLPRGLKSFIRLYHPHREFIVHTVGFGRTSFEGTEIICLLAWSV